MSTRERAIRQDVGCRAENTINTFDHSVHKSRNWAVHVVTDLEEADPLVGHGPDRLQHDRADVVANHTKRVVGRPRVGLARVGQLSVEVDLSTSLVRIMALINTTLDGSEGMGLVS